MNDPAVPGPPPGPKTAVRTGAAHSPFGLIPGEPDRAAVRADGAAVRRALAEEIRAQAAQPARKKRRR